MASSEKWNPNHRGYVENGSKMIAAEDREAQRLGARSMLIHELANDRFGMGWSIMSQARGVSGIKPLAVSPRGGGRAVAPSRESFIDRSYPLVRNIYLYFDRAPGAAVEPRVRRFLEFALSERGQAVVATIGFHPLPAQTIAEQLQTLE